MRYKLQKNWFAQHSKEMWVWALYVRDDKWDDYEDAANIYAKDRDGPFTISVWDWVKREYTHYEGFERLKDAKTVGKFLAGAKFVSFPHEKRKDF
jgi:hypothetical protein